eukprot:746215-Hanusia_phi.AAC.1
MFVWLLCAFVKRDAHAETGDNTRKHATGFDEKEEFLTSGNQEAVDEHIAQALQQMEVEEAEEAEPAGQGAAEASGPDDVGEELEIREDLRVRQLGDHPKRSEVSQRASRFTSNIVRKAASVGQKVDRGGGSGAR